ncbi:RNA polymerase II subunit A domain phosphatase SSU72 [Salpingoeca rosetta]|uniref:RNA polymerase II subunit A C-terminal domain phosphatase SSU72 n=1 Tax=Salpingoeca rosetta (strain ATCC 50818 / BSB-021) TaxID=946362 RepID=F2TVW4_SALR5|nr:RNA polymerase II subunit A domain phosphatase SSU72 [Salpingoeca rosetta]EGD72210.1 RNA polymerase II subunit A domain phosphatase SSU72 [Salpingoeca rosetta]|eukprot:XP_004998781.1 RNA polymerase II subunit A domain phosphatase SSU72 [Salpingoeca rosetta]
MSDAKRKEAAAAVAESTAGGDDGGENAAKRSKLMEESASQAPSPISDAAPSPQAASPSSLTASSTTQLASAQDERASDSEPLYRFRYAVVCSSNQNRSMEAHLFLKQRGFNVESYGTGSCVKIPGPSIDRPNVFEFDSISYDEMYKQLEAQNKALYQQTGMLAMLDRNRKIKRNPEKFQRATDKRFDIILTCETRIFDEVVRDLQQRDNTTGELVHICNLDIKDTHECATQGALNFVHLAQLMEATDDLDEEVEAVIARFEDDTGEELMHSVAFY